LQIQRETYTESYNSVRDLLHHLKRIGGRARGGVVRYPGRTFFTRLEDAYRQHMDIPEGPVTASWQVLTIQARKA
ncbi:MAG: hypothetical protein KDD76_07100, partial [Rickettsiales bacterium]|nr:hypothetical protein [Rickettsiales bacterium]